MDTLLVKIKAGDNLAFNEVFYGYSGKLYGFLYHKTQSAYLANEITQLTFIKLWRYRENLNTDLKLSTQIFQIAKTLMIDELRREGRSKEQLEQYKVVDNIFNTHISSGYDVLDEKDTRQIINQAVKQLPPVRQKVFKLSREEALSHKEISEALSISVKTVDKHIQLALRYIKGLVKIT
ncbi:RNA polymerase sigma-70 factor, ECF subfamily [Arachidicoccus rhizosphaerae]|jgi:RNA polymerase sigma-70 factor (ECF subfamily)|uniref:RNA polymerase sigma-70 factor, ECF subfamily n=1 Tax=Arachidicoccus rhizosphaerae TaxID=551991 RepID=A0A1H4BND1_9BACT|nr:sigma-70 family RNA polymerase sigma factor [Arachidicoccus rhizosphaerae]SEA49597.1 RNA polymerase sigma-70 factor, ECF subfamily [Arachidicoccus rhizosphaerae]